MIEPGEWEQPADENGATDPIKFLDAYKVDDNVFWATDPGHIQNVLDWLIEHCEDNGVFRT